MYKIRWFGQATKQRMATEENKLYFALKGICNQLKAVNYKMFRDTRTRPLVSSSFI